MTGFYEPERFGFVAALESAWAEVRAELEALGSAAFIDAPDSLTTVEDGYDERGWTYYDLFGPDVREIRGGFAGTSRGATEADRVMAEHRSQCPNAAAACASVPGLVNAGFSRFRAGTHLYPHCGELPGVLRCHLPLVVPPGDLGIKIGSESRRWREGQCLIFDDTLEHTAWNHGEDDRVVLLVTFDPAAAS